MKYNVKNIIIPTIIILLMYISCVYANSISISVRSSVQICLNSIVPSMYGFMIVSDLLIRTNSHKIIGKALSPIARYVFHLNGELFAILLISLVAGYPIGAKLISSLEKNSSLDKSTAENMYCYCYSGGLAFILGTIGSTLNDGLKISMIIYISNIISNLILAIILNFKYNIPKKDTSKIKVKISSNIIIDSINSSFKVILTICIMIVSFSIVISIMDSLLISNTISQVISKVFKISESSAHSILNAILEVSNTSKVLIVGKYYIPTLAMIFSFGGLCVVLQIVSISSDSFNLKKFLKCRLFTSIVSFMMSYFLCIKLLSEDITVGYVYKTELTENSSVIPSICLLFMSFILLSKNTRHFGEKVI